MRFAKSRALHLKGWQLVGGFLLLSLTLMLCSLGLYHWVLIKGVRADWPVIGSLGKLVLRDESEQRERFMRENIDELARRVGEMQARILQLESLGERVSGLAGMGTESRKLLASPGSGGVLLAPSELQVSDLQQMLSEMEQRADHRMDWLTVMESRLFDQKIQRMMLPTQPPVPGAPLGSPFGWRIDPFTGRSAMHSGQDYQASPGTPILAAAGGVVVTREYHPEYGNMLEIDHGNNVLTRYAHASTLLAKKGDLVKRGQKIAEVGSTGRSTGPHLHFEVLVQSVFQDPARFLAASQTPLLSSRGPRAPPGSPLSFGQKSTEAVPQR